MKSMKKLKSTGAKLLSAVLVAGLLGGILPSGFGQENTTVQAAAPKHYSADAYRKVVQNINELPHYVDKADYTNAAGVFDEDAYNIDFQLSISRNKGKTNRPFTILEIVDFDEQAEIGFLVGGCEPVDVERMFGDGTAQTSVPSGTLDIVAAPADTYFFADEEEGKAENYKNGISWGGLSPITVDADNNPVLHAKGYYEYVGGSASPFEVVGGKIVKSATNKGYIEWHTVNSFLLTRDEFSTVEFKDTLESTDIFRITRQATSDGDKLAEDDVKKGRRVYTYRDSDADNVVYNVGSLYKIIQNTELFLKAVMELSDEDASQYCVAVKTITTEKLNQNPEWVNYADLIYISSKGLSDNFSGRKKLWNNYRRLQNLPECNKSEDEIKVFFKNHDLNWSVVEKIVTKIAATENYAALVLDKSAYNKDYNPSSGNVSVTLYDTNLQKLSTKFTAKPGTDNNIRKLAYIALCYNPNLFVKYFMPYVTTEIDTVTNREISKLTMQEGDAQRYWNPMTCLLVPEGEYRIPDENYFTNKSYWDNSECLGQNDYGAFGASSVNRRVYTFPENTSMVSSFITMKIGVDSSYFKSFNEYMEGRGSKSEDASPADALRYVLGIQNANPSFGGTLNVLDIEPSVAIDTNHDPIWTLNESTIRFLLPNFTGDINITHMTTAEYVGKVMDICSEYDLVYIGADIGGFNTKKESFQIGTNWVNNLEVTDFNQDAMDRKIYFHMGDYVKFYKAKGQEINFTSATSSDKNTLRYNGNDISALKLAELKSFMDGGHPIIVNDKLYNSDSKSVFIADGDPNCQIGKLLGTEYSAYREKKLFSNKASGGAEACIISSRANIVFTETPKEYYATNSNIEVIDGAAVIKSSAGFINNAGSLNFKFKAPNSNYKFCFYLDKNRDGRFSVADNEQILDASVSSLTYNPSTGEYSFKYQLASSFMGFIQWKAIVYSTTNSGVQKVVTGCSAVKRKPGSTEKKSIKVLQITPDDGGNLNLETSADFKKYYEKLEEFKIEIDTITWTEFNNAFKDMVSAKDASNHTIGKFTYDLSKGVIEEGDESLFNPKKKYIDYLDSKTIATTKYPIHQYNMIIVGFGDGFKPDLDNKYGAAEFLAYFGDRENKSILYTHDNTSLYNEFNADGTSKMAIGTTPNALLRDQMGMNRYKMISTWAETVRSGLSNELKEYQKRFVYDTTYTYASQDQGFTFHAIHKLAAGYSWPNPNLSGFDNNIKQPLKYSIFNPDGSYVMNSGNIGNTNSQKEYSRKTGLADTNYQTTRAAMLNKGQITTYPYYIDDEFKVSSTHPQWYLLNVEDPNVTVWYCLTDNYGTGEYSVNDPAIALAASPMDASNNYYIYSKGNIFYSGVGHSTITSDPAGGDQEIKLFINTMIAAYRQESEPPMVEVCNDDVITNAPDDYELMVLRESYLDTEENNAGGNGSVEVFGDSETVRVEFRIMDGNGSTSFSCRLDFEGMPADLKLYRKSNNTEIPKSGGYFTGIGYSEVVYFQYPRKLLNSGAKEVKIYSKSELHKTSEGLTLLHLYLQPLFFLD